MVNLICNKCKKEMTLKTMYTRSECLQCHAAYQKEYYAKNREKLNEYSKSYQKEKRWLNGTDNNDELGENIKIYLKSINGVLRVNAKKL